MILKCEYVACHCGSESSEDLLELLGKAGHLDNVVKFVCDVQYLGKKGYFY